MVTRKKVAGHPEERQGQSGQQILLNLAGLALLAYLGWLGVRIVDHEKKLSELFAILAPQRLEQTIEKPLDKNTIDTATKILSTAQQRHISIPANLVQQAGAKLIEASDKIPDAWGAALQFADYRSTVINPPLLPPLTNIRAPKPPDSLNQWLPVQGWADTPDMHVTWAGSASSPENAARTVQADIPYPFEHAEGGPEFIIIEMLNKAPFTFDRFEHPERFKNVIFRNATIVYSGRTQIWFDGVYFIDCAFRLSQSPSAGALAELIISSSPVQFKNF